MRLLVRSKKTAKPEAVQDSDHESGYELSPSDLRALAELGNVFGSDKSLDDSLNWLSENIQQLIPYDRFVVNLLTSDRKSLSIIHVSGIGTPRLQLGESDTVDGSLTGYVAATGESFLESSVTESVVVRFPQTAKAIDGGIRSWLSVPLRSDGSTFGSASFLSYTDRKFDERHLHLAEIVSGYIASAVNTDRLREQLRAESKSLLIHNTRGIALREIGLTIGSSLNLHDVFDEFSRLTKLMIPFEYMNIVSLADDETGFWNRYVVGNVESRAPVGVKTSIAGYVARNRKTLIVNLDDDSAVEQMLRSFPDAQFDVSRGYKSMLSVPLIVGNEVKGVIHFRHSVAGTFTEDHVEIAEQIATYVAPAVVNADLHANIQQESEIQEVLAEMSRVMNSTVKIDEILEEIGHLLNSVVPTDRLVISLNDHLNEFNADSYVYGVAVPDWDDKFVERDELVLRAVNEREVTVVSTEIIDTATPETHRPIYLSRQAGLRSAMYAPLIADGNVIGTINVKSTWPHAYLEHQKRVFGQVAQQLAGSIAVSEFSTALQIEAREQEVLAELSRLLSSTVVIGDILDDIGGLMNSLVPADRFVISLFDETTGLAQDNYVYGTAVHGWDGVSDSLPRGHEPSTAALSRSVVVTPTEQIESSILADDRPVYFTNKAGLRSAMYAPLIADGKLIGTLNVKSKQPDAYREHEKSVFEKIAQQMAGSIALSESRAALETDAKEQEQLAEIGRLMSSSVVLEDVFDEFADLLNNLIPFDRIVLALPDADRRFIVDKFIRGTAITNWDENPRHDYALYAQAIDEGNWTTKFVDLTESRWSDLPGVAEAVAVGLRSAVTGSLIADGKLIGSIALKSESADAFDSHYIHLLERICQQVSGAVDASELSQSLQKEALEQEKLAEVGRVINSSNLLDEVWGELALVLSELVDSDRISLAYSFDVDSEVVTILQHGVEIPNIALSRPARTYPKIWSSSLEPFILENSGRVDTADAIAAENNAQSVGLVSTLIAQVKRGNDIVAVLAFRSTRENAYGQADLNMSAKIANQIAGSIANLHAFHALENESRTREILSELGRVLTLSLDLNEIFDQVCEQVQKLIPLDRFSLSSLSENNTSLTMGLVYGQEIEEQPQNWKVPLPPEAFSAINAQRDAIIVNAESISEYPWLGFIYQQAVKAGLLSFIGCPVVWQDQVIGLLGFKAAAENAYDQSDLQMAELIANRIAGSVAGSAAYQAARQENEVRKALASLSVMAARDLNLKNVGERVVDGLRSLVPFDRFTIISYDAETKIGTLDFVKGVPLPGDEIGIEVGRYEYPLDWMKEEFIQIGSEGESRDERLAALGLNSWITKPLGTENTAPIGFISIRNLNDDFYTDEHNELIRQVALQITPAIQNAKVHEQSVQLAQQREQGFALDLENKELQRVADSRSEFLSTVSHELRTPLTAISAFADILHRNGPENLTQRQLDQLEVVRRSSTNLAELIDDLLDVSRADSGRLQVDFRPFNFTEAVEEFRIGTLGFIQTKNQSLDIQMPDQEIWLNADKSRLLQILNNLSANASKYSSEGSVINISIEMTGQRLNVIFEDHGIGISKSDLKSVFTPFFRADNLETRQEVGTGLGLTVVNSLVALHQGDLELESEVGVGTRVKLSLPCVISRPEYVAETPE